MKLLMKVWSLENYSCVFQTLYGKVAAQKLQKRIDKILKYSLIFIKYKLYSLNNKINMVFFSLEKAKSDLMLEYSKSVMSNERAPL